MNKIIGIFISLILLISIPAAFADDENTGIGLDVDANVTVSVDANSDENNDDSNTGSNETERSNDIDSDDDGLGDASEEETVEDDEVTEETLEEAKLVNESGIGAEVRLLQLERAALKAVVAGEVIVEILANNEEVSELEAILEEIKLVHEQIQEMDTENSTASDYVAIKKSLKDLVSDFRKIAGPLLNANDREEVRAEIDASVEIDELNAEIRATIRALNAERVRAQLARMGVTNDELIEDIENGEATPSEVRSALREAWSDLNNIQKRASVKDMRDKIYAGVQERIEIRKEAINNFKVKQKELLEKRIAKIRERNDTIRENVKERVLDRIDARITARTNARAGGR